MPAPGSFFTSHRKKKLFNFLVICLAGPGVIGDPLSPTTNDCEERVRELPRPTRPAARKTTTHLHPRFHALFVFVYTRPPLPAPRPCSPHPSQNDMQALISAAGRRTRGRVGKGGAAGGTRCPELSPHAGSEVTIHSLAN